MPRFRLLPVALFAALLAVLPGGQTPPAVAQVPAVTAADVRAMAAGAGVVLASSYGAKADGTTDARTAIQTALNACPAGGRVLLDKPGTYRLTATGSGLSRLCLSMPSNVGLLIPPNVTLKLADSQATAGNSMYVVRIPTGTSNVYVGWPDGPAGWIDGNTANQPGWTGGYGQSNGYELVSAGTGVSYLTFDGLRLKNSFGNTLNVGGGSTYGGGGHHVWLRNTYSEHQGEGPQVIACDRVWWDGAECVIDADMAGDCCELAFCRDFHVRNVVSRTSDGNTTTVGGSALDLYASRRGTVAGVVGTGCVYGMQVETDFSSNLNWPDEIEITNVSLRSINFGALVWTGGRVSVSNLTSTGQLGSAFQLSNTAHSTAGRAVFKLDNCRWTGTTSGYLGQNCDLIANNVTLDDSGAAAPLINTGHTSGQPAPRLVWTGGRLSGTVPALQVSGTGTGPTGSVVGADVTALAPTSGFLCQTQPGSAGTFKGLVVDLEYTNVRPADGLTGVRRWSWLGTIAATALPAGSKGQVVEFSGFTGPNALTLQSGARLKLAGGAASVTLAGPYDSMRARYDEATDVWYELSRTLTTP